MSVKPNTMRELVGKNCHLNKSIRKKMSVGKYFAIVTDSWYAKRSLSGKAFSVWSFATDTAGRVNSYATNFLSARTVFSIDMSVEYLVCGAL